MGAMIAYIAGPMKGHENLNYPAFEKVTTGLREMGLEVLSPHEIDLAYPNRAVYNDPQQEWLWYMTKCIPMVFKAQVFVLLEGWENSQGATIEWCIAKERGMPIYRYPSSQLSELILMVKVMETGSLPVGPIEGGFIGDSLPRG